jgi:CDP-diacylglycerol---glycerol-3-phosphate 3-phosphatidyltransferase
MTKPAMTLSESMRLHAQGVLEPIARFFIACGFTANSITLLGTLGNAIGGALLALGYVPLGGGMLLLSVPLDALDGALARLSGTVSKAGAFLDSVTDRWSEIFLFGGLAVWYARQGEAWGVVLCFAAITGSLMVSYTKARAEGLGMPCNVGLLTRAERYIIMLPALILNLPMIGTGIIALLTYFTALQRMAHVLSAARSSAGTDSIGSRTS